MSSSHVFWLALACIVTGAVVHVLQPDGPIALLLVGAGTAAFGGSTVLAKREAKVETDKANRRADEAFEQTQTLRRDMLRK